MMTRSVACTGVDGMMWWYPKFVELVGISTQLVTYLIPMSSKARTGTGAKECQKYCFATYPRGYKSEIYCG